MDAYELARWIPRLTEFGPGLAEEARRKFVEGRVTAAIPALIAALKGAAACENTDGARANAEAVAGIGGDAAAAGLVEALLLYDQADIVDAPSDAGDESWRATTAIEHGLARLGAVATGHLRPVLTHANRTAARAAAGLLTRIRDPQIIDALVTWASERDDDREEDRLAAIRLLAESSEPRVLEALIALASNEVASAYAESTVRIAACEALGRIGGGRARATLTSLRDDSHPGVRTAASTALSAADRGSATRSST